MPVPRAFQFRLILHMGGTGECSVLSDAIEMETVEGERYILTEEDAARTRRGETARLRVTVAYVRLPRSRSHPATRPVSFPAPRVFPAASRV